MSKRAALYPRVSTGQQEEEGTSLGSQEAACRRYAVEHGYTVDEAHIYREVHTGTELWERPKLTALREAIRRHQVDTVICYAIDRLARDPVHLGVILTEADHAGVAVDFVTEPLDNTPEGQLIRFVRGYAAKVEHEKIRERTIRGKRARVQSGRLVPGPRPLYGYLWRDDSRSSLRINDATAPIVQRIYTEAFQGKAIRKIAVGLMRDSIPAPKGGTVWNASTLNQLLRHPSYCGRAVGWARVHGHAWSMNYEQAIDLPQGTIPPLIDVEVWESIQQQLKRNKELATRNNKDPEGALLRNGYARCGYCGRSMFVARLSDKRPLIYRCSNYGAPPEYCGKHAINTPILDAAVWQRVEALLTDPTTIAAEVAKLRSEDPTAADVVAIDRDLAKVDRQRANIARAIALMDADEPDAAAPLIAELSLLAKRKQQLEAERDRIAERRAGWVDAQARLDSLQQWCADVAGRLRTFSYAEKRLALEALGVRALVFRQDHEPRYVIEANIPLGSDIVSTTSRCTGHNNVLTLRWTDTDVLMAA